MFSKVCSPFKLPLRLMVIKRRKNRLEKSSEGFEGLSNFVGCLVLFCAVGRPLFLIHGFPAFYQSPQSSDILTPVKDFSRRSLLAHRDPTFRSVLIAFGTFCSPYSITEYASTYYK